MFKRGSESQLTYSLKWSAWEWLYQQAHCHCIGMEVRMEGPSGRVVDLAAVGPGNTIYVVEVKSSRADFARDDHTLADLKALKARSEPLIRRGRLARQTLRQATGYAQQKGGQDWEQEPAYRSALADYQRILREETAYQCRLNAFSVKFHDQRFLNLADYYYIIAPREVVPVSRVPPQWGLLDETPEIVVQARQQKIRKNSGIIANVMRAIARSNSGALLPAWGVESTGEGTLAQPDSSSDR